MSSPSYILSTFVEGGDDPRARLWQRIWTHAVAAVAEIAVLVGLWFALGVHEPPAIDNAEPITMTEPPAPMITPAQLQKIEPPQLKPMPVRMLPHIRLAIDRAPPVPAPQTLAEVPPAPTPPAQPSPPNREAQDRFQAQVRQAIQTAIVYPQMAKMLKQQGRAKVSFVLTAGHAENPQIIESSGYPAIDAAALAAVRSADYPTPPPELGGRPLAFAVYVLFNLTN